MTDKNTHSVGLKIQTKPPMIEIYIDRDRINALSFYPTNEIGRRLSDEEMLKMDFEIKNAEIEVRDIYDIAIAMNEKTFNEFCKMWRKYHGKQ